MSKMTDRIDNQNIINLARQQYENEKRNKLPTVVVPLDSAGKIYPVGHPLRNGTVEMRYMTAYDEDILTNISYIKNGIVFDKLLESVIMTPNAYQDISVVDKLGLIVRARILAYGAEYNVVIADPKTGNELNRTINLNQLKPKPFTLECNELGEFAYEVNSTHTIFFKFPTTDSVDDSISAYLKNVITQVNDSRDANVIDNFIRYEFFAGESKQFRKYIADNTPGIDLSVEIEGEDGDTFTTGFQLGSQLFWF